MRRKKLSSSEMGTPKDHGELEGLRCHGGRWGHTSQDSGVTRTDPTIGLLPLPIPHPPAPQSYPLQPPAQGGDQLSVWPGQLLREGEGEWAESSSCSGLLLVGEALAGGAGNRPRLHNPLKELRLSEP